MTPNQLQDNAQAILDLYAQAEETMLRAVARRAAKGITQPGWAERKLAEVQELEKQLRDELDALSRKSSELRNGLVNGAYQSGWDLFSKEIKQLTGGNIKAIPPSRFNTSLGIINELNQSFDALHSAILRSTSDAYRDVIGKAVAALSTGTITSRQAIKQALNEFADKGITGFTDKAGRHWQMDSYAEMAVRTGMARAIRQGYTDDMQAHDEHLVIISDHQDTCPLCIDWERSVLAIDDAGLNHPDCDGSLAEAEAAGLFHPNCQHSMTVYVPGLTIRASGKSTQGYTREQDLQGYQNRQKQRSMERQVRAWKRRQAVALTPEDERYARAKVQLWQQRLREHVDNTGLPRLYYREGGRVTLSQAARKLPPTKLPGMTTPKRETEAEKWLRLTGHSFDGYTPDQQKELRKLFESAPELERKLYEKYAGQLLEHSENIPKDTAYYKPGDGYVYLHTSEAAAGSTISNPYQTQFHEYGHNLDHLAGGGIPGKDYHRLSTNWRDSAGNSFKDLIMSDWDKAVKQGYSYKDVADAAWYGGGKSFFHDIANEWRRREGLSANSREYRSLLSEIRSLHTRSDMNEFAKKYFGKFKDAAFDTDKYLQNRLVNRFINGIEAKYPDTRVTGNLSDMFEEYSMRHNGPSYPFGAGHHDPRKTIGINDYWDRQGALEREAFAEMMDSRFANPDALDLIKQYLPNAYQAYLDMIEEAIK